MLIIFCIIASTISAGTLGCSNINRRTITTRPNLPENKLARNYPGLILATELQRQLYSSCAWNIQSASVTIDFLNPEQQCFNVTTNNFADVQCISDNTSIVTALHVISPLDIISGKSEIFSITCVLNTDSSSTTPVTLSIMIADCPSSIPPLIINSASASYNSSGTFSCSNDGTLFYSNGTQPYSPQTTCLPTAQWSGQNEIECWKAPYNVNIVGNLTVLEGHNVSLTCSYTEGVPDETNIIFNVNNIVVEVQEYKATLNRNDHNKPVYCQANNSFTAALPENDGRSPTVRFNVLYAPFQNTSDPCSFYSETPQDNLECEVVFYSNPNASFISVIDAISGVELDSSRVIVIDGTSGKHTYKYRPTGFEVTNSTTYNLTVRSSVPPFYHSIPFAVKVLPSLTAFDELTILIVVVVFAVALVSALVVLGLVCWRRRQKQSSSKKHKTGSPVAFSTSSNGQQKAIKRNEPHYLSIDGPNETKAANEQTGGYENVNMNPSTSNQQQLKDGEYVNTSNTPYINLNLTETSFPLNSEVEYEMMNPQVVTKK